MTEANVRFSRHMLLPEIGEEGQRKLRSSLVTICGVGGLGSPVAQYLTAAGIGKIRLVDPDSVEESNLNRQVLHWDEDCDANRPKVESAADKLKRMSKETEVQIVKGPIDAENVSRILGGSTVIIDCLDNFDARFVLNRYCVGTGTPLVHAAVEGWAGQATVIVPGRTPCLACLVKKAPPVKRPIPILGAVAGVFGCIQSAEAVKQICGIENGLAGRLLIADLKEMTFDTFDVERDDRCPVCGKTARSSDSIH